jgi:hypothetical protein
MADSQKGDKVNVAKLVFRKHANHRLRMCMRKRPLKMKPCSRQPRKTQPNRARRTRANPQSTDQLRNPYAVKTHERHIAWTA